MSCEGFLCQPVIEYVYLMKGKKQIFKTPSPVIKLEISSLGSFCHNLSALPGVKSSSASVSCIDFESLRGISQMSAFPHCRWILWCQPWITSVNPPPHTAPTPPPHPHLINIAGCSSSNNVVLTVHALPLWGGLAPCIPASQTHTHTPKCDSQLKRKKKKQKEENHNSADQSCSARLLLTRGPWQKQPCLRCREPRVCPSLISKKLSPLSLNSSSWDARLRLLTHANFHRKL